MAVKIAEAKIAVQRRTTKTLNTAEIMTKKRVQRLPAPTKRALNVFNAPSETDVNGSYTGKPKDKTEIPVQDVDDL